MRWRERRIVGWISVVILLIAMGAGAFILLGAAAPADEVLSVEVAVYINAFTGFDEYNNDRIPVYICIAVTSPSRGAVDQLREGNIRVYDPIYGPEGPKAHADYAVEVQDISNLGGGFYLIEVLPWIGWELHQYVLQIEVVCPWGRGITVCELPVMQVPFW